MRTLQRFRITLNRVETIVFAFMGYCSAGRHFLEDIDILVRDGAAGAAVFLRRAAVVSERAAAAVPVAVEGIIVLSVYNTKIHSQRLLGQKVL